MYERTVGPATYRGLLTTYLGGQWPGVALLAVLLLGGIGLQLASPQIVQRFIDTAQQGGDLGTLVVLAALFLGIALLVEAVSVAETYVASTVGWIATNALRADLLGRALELDLAFHHVHPPGELIERIDGDVTVLANFFSRFVLRLLTSALLLLGALGLLWREDARIGVALTALSAAALLLLGRLSGIGARFAYATRQARANLFSFLEERLGGLVDLHAVGAQAYTVRRFTERLDALTRRVRQATLVRGAIGGATGLLLTIGTVGALALAIWSFQAGSMTLGGVYLIYRYTTMLREPLGELHRQARDFQGASASITRVRQLVEERATLGGGSVVVAKRHAAAMEFRGVTFGYRPETPVLHDVSFWLRPGEVLGLLGRTGSGKSSIGRLLARLYDPQRGSILLDGVDLREIERASLRRSVGVVTQDVQLWQGTVRENLTLFDRGITDERVRAALDALGLEAWLARLPQGLDTVVGPGSLSAGEAQLLAFGRVFLRDPAVVILDEASSRLDPATERQLEEATDRLLIDRTAIVIAHRLATLERADQVMLLDAGRIVEIGPRALLANDPGTRFHELLRASRGGAVEREGSVAI